MDQSLATPRFINRVLLTLMGILVSMVAFLAIIHRWHAFSSVAKFDAIIFLLILVTNPLFELLAEKKRADRIFAVSRVVFWIHPRSSSNHDFRNALTTDIRRS